MTIAHTTPEEVIKMQQATIDQLRATNATLTALNLKLQTTDLTPAEIAQTLIAGCPGWIEVTGHLFFARIMLEAPTVKQHSCKLSERNCNDLE